MNTTKIDASQLNDMLHNGLSNLRAYEAEINKLNVFPVADGDTGTNMRLTLENGLEFTSSDDTAGEYLKKLNNGMLLGARGNSGVILSQIFKGIYLALSQNDVIGIEELFSALERGYKTAYDSVVNPVEGTILTVTRDGVENIRDGIRELDSIEALLSAYIYELRKSLENTPELLSVLKSAGVVDSGAMGYCIIVEGMLKHLNGEMIKSDMAISNSDIKLASSVDLNYFNEDSKFEDGYCMEYLLQLMNSSDYRQDFEINEYISVLNGYGNSIVAIQDDKRVKVHIHTKKPADIITYTQGFGEFLTFKLENMQLQHNERDDMLKKSPDKANEERKLVSIVSVADGDGFYRLFYDLGCDAVIDGGATMNPPAYEFLNAFNKLNADNIIVLPNNKNAISAAEQAKSLYDGKSDIYVVESEDMIDAYYAIAMDLADSNDIEFRLSQMKNAIKNNQTLAIAPASKDFSLDGTEVSRGNNIAIIDGKIKYASDNMVETVISGLGMLSDIEDREICMIATGIEMNDSQEMELADAIEDSFPDLEVSFVYGGQHIYYWLIGLI